MLVAIYRISLNKIKEIGREGEREVRARGGGRGFCQVFLLFCSLHSMSDPSFFSYHFANTNLHIADTGTVMGGPKEHAQRNVCVKTWYCKKENKKNQ